MKVALSTIVLSGLLLFMVHVTPQPSHALIPQTTSVQMANTQFVPSVIRINVGEAITWTNTDQVQHTVTSATSGYNFSSALIGLGGKFTLAFNAPGLVIYYCAVHPTMIGRIYVGIDPPQSEIASGSGNFNEIALSMNKLSDGRVLLTASLAGVPGTQVGGIPVSFFARYSDSRTIYWLRLNTLPTQSDGSIQLVLSGNHGETSFQAFASLTGDLKGVYSNVVGPQSLADSAVPVASYWWTYMLASAFAILLAVLILRKSRGPRSIVNP